MTTVKASSKGQIVIPKSIREALRIREGTELHVQTLSDESVLLQVVRPERAEHRVKDAARMLARYGRRRGGSKRDESDIARVVTEEDERTMRGRRKGTR